MDTKTPFIALLLVLPLALAGCVGLGDTVETGSTEITPTGRTVELRVWTEATSHEVYPDFEAHFTAFCVEAAPGSEDVLERRDNATCSVPGPTIHLDQGDRLVLSLADPNELATGLVWPGVEPATLTAGAEATLDRVVMAPGTQLYTGTGATATADGLFGAVIVEPQDQRLEPDVDVDHLLLLSHATKARLLDPASDDGTGDEDVFMINARSYPNTENVVVDEDDRVRIRLVNAGTIVEAMHLHGHDMFVTHEDGQALPAGKRFIADTVLVDPGKSFDVYVEADNPGLWHFHTHFDQRVTNDHMSPGGMMTHLQYDGFPAHGRFKAALTGGMGATPPGGSAEPMPPDHTQTERGELMDIQYETSYAFPVADARAQGITLTLTLAAGTPLDELTLTLVDASGTERGTATANADTPTAALSTQSVTATGDWTAIVAGRGLQASYVLDILVDYPDVPEGGGGGHGGHH